LWRHFPVDDQRPEELAYAILDFQRNYDFDLVKVTPASSFCIKDWGADDEWRGNTEGTRDYGYRVVHAPDDWLKLRQLDPYEGSLGNQLTCLRMVCDELGSDVPVLQTIFSPLAQAKNLSRTKSAVTSDNTRAVRHGLGVQKALSSLSKRAAKRGWQNILRVQHGSFKATR
jgi:uroporphyrinogen decarboxylase